MKIEHKYCDRCGEKCDELFRIRVPNEKGSYGEFTVREMEVCKKCQTLHNNIVNTLTDIRFSMYENIFFIMENKK